MAVAFFIAHAKDAFDVKALAFIFLLLSIVVFVLGSGRFSIDRWLFKIKMKKAVLEMEANKVHYLNLVKNICF
jgi:putative oxidoreductase